MATAKEKVGWMAFRSANGELAWHKIAIPIVVFLLGLVGTLSGMLYAKTEKTIDSKADKPTVVALEKRVNEKADYDTIMKMLELEKQRYEMNREDIQEQKVISKEILKELQQMNIQMIKMEKKE